MIADDQELPATETGSSVVRHFVDELYSLSFRP